MKTYYVLCYINKHGGLSECVNNEMIIERGYAVSIMRYHNRNSTRLRYVLKKVYL